MSLSYSTIQQGTELFKWLCWNPTTSWSPVATKYTYATEYTSNMYNQLVQTWCFNVEHSGELFTVGDTEMDKGRDERRQRSLSLSAESWLRIPTVF